MIDSALNVVIALVAIVAVIVGLGFAVRRLQGSKLPTAPGIELITSRMLGPKERLLLVQVQNQQVLIGMNAQCIASLATFDAPESFERRLKEASEG